MSDPLCLFIIAYSYCDFTTTSTLIVWFHHVTYNFVVRLRILPLFIWSKFCFNRRHTKILICYKIYSEVMTMQSQLAKCIITLQTLGQKKYWLMNNLTKKCELESMIKKNTSCSPEARYNATSETRTTLKCSAHLRRTFEMNKDFILNYIKSSTTVIRRTNETFCEFRWGMVDLVRLAQLKVSMSQTLPLANRNTVFLPWCKRIYDALCT